MKTRNILGIVSIGLVLGVSLIANPRQAISTPTAIAASDFAVDTVHSSMIFKISHMDLVNFYGRFNSFDGSYSLDEADPTNSRFKFEVKAESVDTNNGRRDGHLRSADFFNVTEYPTITFNSTNVSKKSDNVLTVTGDLTLRGVTKPITSEFKITPARDTRQGFKGGFETTFTVKRTEFDMSYGVAEGGLGDEVTVTVAVEGVRK